MHNWIKLAVKVLSNERGGFMIESGTGGTNLAGVTDENQLLTQSETHELQHHISIKKGQVYQVIGTHTLSVSGTLPILHIKNTDSIRNLLVSYTRVQFVGDGTIDEDTYFQLGFGRIYSGGGTITTPVNMNTKSGNVADVVCYGDNPTLTGTFAEIDRWHPDKSMMTFNKHGSLILGLSDTLEWRLVTDQSSGVAYSRVTMMMSEE